MDDFEKGDVVQISESVKNGGSDGRKLAGRYGVIICRMPDGFDYKIDFGGYISQFFGGLIKLIKKNKP